MCVLIMGWYFTKKRRNFFHWTSQISSRRIKPGDLCSHATGPSFAVQRCGSLIFRITVNPQCTNEKKHHLVESWSLRQVYYLRNCHSIILSFGNLRHLHLVQKHQGQTFLVLCILRTSITPSNFFCGHPRGNLLHDQIKSPILVIQCANHIYTLC